MNIQHQRHSLSLVRAHPSSNCASIRLAFFVLVTVALAIFSAGFSMAQTPGRIHAGGIIYTADERGNSISAIDISTGQVTTVPIKISPHNVQITTDGTRLLAVGDPAIDGKGHAHGAAHGSGKSNGRLLVFDASAVSKGPVADIVVGTHPAHVIVDQWARHAFVTNAGDSTVSIVDMENRKIVKTIRAGRYPHGLRMSPKGREVYVANVQDGSLSVIDASTLTEVARIPVGKAPVQVGFTPDGSRVYVSLRDENSVAVVDTTTRKLIGKIGVGRNPIQVYATPDGRFVYVANQGTDTQPADTVSVIEVAANKVVDTIRTGKGAHGVVVSDDGGFVFVTNIVDGTVSAIDVASRKIAATFPVGHGPNGITYRPTRR